MTNYEKLFQDQMHDPQFARAYYKARLDRIFRIFGKFKRNNFQGRAKRNSIKNN